MADLGDFLLAAGHRERVPAVFDCCAFPADWAVANGWPDPMAKWRGAYETETEALDLIDAAGGLAVLFSEGMASVGIPTSETFALGDIAVVSVQGHEAGAIFCGKRWAFAADRGFAAASLDPDCILQAWRVAGG